MPGLIPLMLNPAAAGTRSSVIAPSPQSPSSEDDSLQQVTSPPATTQYAPAAFQRLTRRFSTTPSALPMLPYTPSEWARAVAEVKRLYLHRRYRPCSARCSNILDNIKDTSNIEPAYLIYLHFYAALSMEMSARALGGSPHRTNLLRQAETHYTRAASLIQSEDSSLKRFSRASSSTTSISTHSPMSSVSSRESTTSTRLSSPTPSLFEERLPSAMRSGGSSAPKKRVTFSDMQPVIRPDSPTLGFDDWVVEPKAVPEPLQPAARPAEEVPIRYSGLFFDAGTDRYASVLDDLLTQVNVHLAAVRSELREDPPSGRSTPESVASSHGSSASVASVGSSEDGREDLRERIDRLKLNGWRRRRFDPGRYEALRESVLAELD